MIQITSSVTTTVLGEMKIVLILVLSALLLRECLAAWVGQTILQYASRQNVQASAQLHVAVTCRMRQRLCRGCSQITGGRSSACALLRHISDHAPLLVTSAEEGNIWTVKMLLGCSTAIMGEFGIDILDGSCAMCMKGSRPKLSNSVCRSRQESEWTVLQTATTSGSQAVTVLAPAFAYPAGFCMYSHIKLKANSASPKPVIKGVPELTPMLMGERAGTGMAR